MYGRKTPWQSWHEEAQYSEERGLTLTQRNAQAAPEEDEVWGTSSGMADDFDGWIREPFFGVDESYNAEAVLFCADLVDAEGEPITTLKYSVGQGWTPAKDGSSISHTTKTKVNNSARFGIFIERLIGDKSVRSPKAGNVTSPKGQENGLGLLSTLKARGTPLEAASYDGLGFHWKQHHMPTLGKDDAGEIIYKDVLLPVEFLGEAGTATAPVTKAAKPNGAPAKAAPAAATASDDTDVSIPAPLRKKLTPMAQSTPAREFIRAASKDKDVITAADEVMNHILDGGTSGFWASVQA